jgi:hypothetical protein
MISDRTKQFIFNALIKDLSNVEMIRHDESLWFIDREKKYWYLELVKTGKLYWRYQFFTEFFDMYSIDREVYEPIIKEFVELVLNNRITTTAAAERKSKNRLEDALNSGNPPFLIAGSIPNTSMDSVLNNGITSTHEIVGLSKDIVVSVLNNGITSTEVEFGVFRNEIVEDALNDGITLSRPANKSLTIVDSVLNEGVTTKLRGGNATEQIKSVLKNGVKSTDCEFLSLESEVDSVLTNGITSTNSTKLLSHIRLDFILKEGVGNLIPLNAYRETMIKYVLKDKPTNE